MGKKTYHIKRQSSTVWIVYKIELVLKQSFYYEVGEQWGQAEWKKNGLYSQTCIDSNIIYRL